MTPSVRAGEGAVSATYARRSLRGVAGFRIPGRTAHRVSEAVIVTTGSLGSGESFGLWGYEIVYRAGRSVYRTDLHQILAVCAAPGERCDPSPLMDRLFAESWAARSG
jgi:hypothetical protein